MKTIDDYFVPWLQDLKMYISPHIELAWEQPELIRMMSNENPYPPSEKVQAAIAEYGKIANRYPEQGKAVRSKIAEINGLEGYGNVLIGNGSSEVYDMLWRSLIYPGDEIIQHTPCFGIYKLRCAVVGGKLVSVPMRYENGAFEFDIDAVIAAVTDKTKAVVIAHPNNPTGNFMSEEDWIKLLEVGLPTISDEAYIEYSGLDKSYVRLIKDFPNLIVTRTLS